MGSEDEGGGGSMLSEGIITLLGVSVARRPGARRHLLVNLPAAAAVVMAAAAVVAAVGVEDGPGGRAGPVKVDSNYTVNFTTLERYIMLVMQLRVRPLPPSRGTGHY